MACLPSELAGRFHAHQPIVPLRVGKSTEGFLAFDFRYRAQQVL